MKGEKARLIIIYILIAVIIGLVGYLIYNFFMNTNDENDDITDPAAITDSIITEDCTFEVTSNDYSTIINGQTSNICGGFNKLVINDIVLDGKNMDVSVIYYNGDSINGNNNAGFYIDDKRVVKNASKKFVNHIGVFDNKLFIFSPNDGKPNVVVYNSLGERIYDLETALAQAKISDPAFTELAKTNTSLDTTLKNSSINSATFNFEPTGFTFSTDAKNECKVGEIIGSTYSVAFSGNDFTLPQFVSYVNCNS